jgi:parallel beta-helix repeat protein
MSFNFPIFSAPQDAVKISPGSNINAIVNKYSQGTSFLLLAGEYRLQSITPKTGMSFYGEVKNGQLLTRLNGSTLISSSLISQLSSNLYVINGQKQESQPSPLDENNQPRTEAGWERSIYNHDVFINDKRLQHASSVEQVKPGKFYFDYKNDRVYLADNPFGKKVEIATSPFAFKGKSNLTIRNLDIQKYANEAETGAINTDSNSLIEGNQVSLNHGSGIRLKGDNRTIVSKNYIYNNGSKGIGAPQATNSLIENNEVAFNNANFFAYSYEASGIKTSGSDNIIRNNYVHDNNGRGIWTDVNAKRITIDSNLVLNNAHIGIAYEVSSDGIIKRNTVGDNGRLGKAMFSSQILIQNSYNMQVYENNVQVQSTFGQGINILEVAKRAENNPGYLSFNNSIYNNKISYLGKSGYSGAIGPTQMYAKNRFYNNGYFFSPGDSTRRFAWNGSKLTFAQFQSLGQEAGGFVSNVRFPFSGNWQFSSISKPASLMDSPSTLNVLATDRIDVLVGSIDDNLLVGLIGNDTLISGSKSDKDVFRFNHIGEGQDIIKDFDSDDSLAIVGDDRDSIQVVLEGFAATGKANNLQKGMLPDNRLVKETDDLGSNSGFRYFESSGNLYFDSNGGSFDHGTGSLLLAKLSNQPTIYQLKDSIVVI